MALTKAQLQRISVAEWQAFDARHPAPSFHAKPAWALALNDRDPRVIPSPHVLRLPSGASVFLPLVRNAGGRLHWRCYEGMPQDGHNVFLTTEGHVVDGALLRETLTALSHCSFDSLVLNFSPALRVAYSPAWTARRFDASMLDLGPGAAEALARMRPAARRMAEHALRDGIECFRRTDGAALDAFYRLHPERWANARTFCSQRFIEVLMHYAPRDVEIWFARQHGSMIAGAIVLYGAQEAYVWLTVVADGVMPLHAFSAFHMAGVHAAVARGIRWYNLGSSEGLPDVRRLKEALGVPAIPYVRLALEKGAFKVYRRWREGGPQRRSVAASF